MSTPPPTPPAPGASAEACANSASRELFPEYAQFESAAHGPITRKYGTEMLAKQAAIITRHFAPLLARVAELEKERDQFGKTILIQDEEIIKLRKEAMTLNAICENLRRGASENGVREAALQERTEDAERREAMIKLEADDYRVLYNRLFHLAKADPGNSSIWSKEIGDSILQQLAAAKGAVRALDTIQKLKLSLEYKGGSGYTWNAYNHDGIEFGAEDLVEALSACAAAGITGKEEV